MPYNAAQELALNLTAYAGGRDIYVDNVNGNDTTGDGSIGNPLATVQAGANLVVSGRGDVLWIVNSGTVYSFSTVTFTQIRGFSVRGIGQPALTPVNAIGVLTSSFTRISNNVISVTFASNHNLVVGDRVVFNNVVESGVARINGAWRCSTITSPTVARFTAIMNHTTTGPSSNAAPYTGSATGAMVGPMHFSFQGCQDYFVDGITFQGASIVGNPIGGMGGILTYDDASGNFTIGNKNFIFSNLEFLSGIFGYLSRTNRGAALDIFAPSTSGLVQKCNFSNGYVTGIDGTQGLFPSIMLDGGAECVFNRCTLQHAPILSASQAKAVIRAYGRNPKFNYTFYDCTRGENIATSEFFGNQSDESVTTSRTQIASDAIRFTGNLYQGETSQIALVDSEASVRDREAASFAALGEEQTRNDLIWDRLTENAMLNAGTIGRGVGTNTLYRGGVWVDETNSTGNAVSGTTPGVHGTPDQPCTTWLEAIVIGSALGTSNIFVYGPLTSSTFAASAGGVIHGVSGPDTDSIDPASLDWEGVTFENITVSGTFGSGAGSLTFRECVLDDATGLDGTGLAVLARGTLGVKDGGSLNLLNAAADEIGGVTIDFGTPAAITTFAGGNLFGTWNFVNANGAGACTTGLGFTAGTATFAATCTLGGATVSGIGSTPVLDSSGGSFFVTDSLITNVDISETLLQTVFAGLSAAGNVAEALAFLDSAISGRAAPGDAMDLVAGRQAEITRLFGENARSREFFASSDINTLPVPGRFVPSGASSHIEVQIRAEGAGDFSSPVATFYIVFGYETGASNTDTPSANTISSSAPVDGSFTASTYSTGFPS